MGVLTMGFQGGSSSNGKQSLLQPFTHQSSMYNLTLDEVQNQLGELGKPLGSMNLDELLKTVWTAEANHTQFEGIAMADQITLSKKTVDQVWRDIQQSKNNEERKSRTLGEMTLEDFLVKAGIASEATSEDKDNAHVSGLVSYPQQSQWLHYSQAQYQPPQRSMIMHMGHRSAMDVSYPENQVALPCPLTGKRGLPEDMVEKTVERRQKRMIKNRESAARSRARKQAYTNELENKVSRLEEENERLRKHKEVETMLLARALPPEPKFQLRRTTSAPF